MVPHLRTGDSDVSVDPGTLNNQFEMDGNGQTSISYIKTWFIIQLKQPFTNGCLKVPGCNDCVVYPDFWCFFVRGFPTHRILDKWKTTLGWCWTRGPHENMEGAVTRIYSARLHHGVRHRGGLHQSMQYLLPCRHKTLHVSKEKTQIPRLVSYLFIETWLRSCSPCLQDVPRFLFRKAEDWQ